MSSGRVMALMARSSMPTNDGDVIRDAFAEFLECQQQADGKDVVVSEYSCRQTIRVELLCKCIIIAADIVGDDILFFPILFYLSSTFLADFLQGNIVGGSGNPIFCDDCRDEAMVCHIKSGIVDLDAFRRHALLVPHLRDLLRRTLLNLDACPRRRRKVNCQNRCTDVERDSVVFREDGNA